MKELFAVDNYKKFLQNLVYSPEAKRGFQAQIAKAMGCQAAYLSQVIKGKPELSEDHAVKLAQFLRLPSVATEYLILLVRLSRASTPELRDYLEGQRTQLLRDNEEVQSRVKSKKSGANAEFAQRYFSSWIPSTVHMAASSENFQTVPALASRLRLPEAKLEETLRALEEMNLVERKGAQWKYANGPIHFPRQASVNVSHQVSRRHQAIRSIEEGDAQDLHFSSIFTVDIETFKEIKSALLDYIEKSHKKIHASGTAELYSMCLDIFRVV